MAQEPPHWRVFTSSDGLRESWVEDVTEGADGRVWIAHGAVDAHTAFDGYTFSHIPSGGAPLKIREGPTGQIWALLPGAGPRPTYRGVQFFDGQRWTAFPVDALADAELTRGQFVPWQADRVLLLTPTAILEFDRVARTGRVVCRAVDTRVERFTELSPAADGGAWVGGIGGVVHLALDGTRRALPLGGRWKTDAVRKIRDVAGRVFASVGAEGRSTALALDGRMWREIARSGPGESVDAWGGRDGTTWIASVTARGFLLSVQSDGGCCRRDLERTKAFSGRLHAVEPLADGGFWLATSLGLVRHAPAAWRSPPELASTIGTAGALFEASTGELYATHDAGLLRYSNARWQRLPLPPGSGIDAGTPMNVAELSDGRILFGVNTPSDGTIAFDPRRARFEPILHPSGRSVRMLGPATGGGAWVVTREGRHYRLERFDGARFTERLDVGERWMTGVPRTVLELGGDHLLLTPDGTGVGLVRQNRHDVLDRAHGYPGAGSFTAFALDGGHFWFGDRDSVLSFDGRRWQTVRTGLQTVRSIVRTRDGSIWVASGSGLHRYREGAWMTVDAAEGLPDGSVNDILEDRAGTLWVSTTSGLSRYDATRDRDAPQTSLDVPGNPTEAPPSGAIPIVFAGRDRWNYTRPDRLLFAWRLDGGAWSPAEPRAAVPLEGLTPGRHRIDVRATDRNWNVDPTPATRQFVVLLPWYRESGFLVAGAFGAMGLLLSLGSFVWRHVRLERLVGERTTALAEANAHLRSELADRHRMEQDRARLEGQLHQAQKLEAVGRLAGGIAHDFNNLLTVITGFAELALDDPTISPSTRTSIDEIGRAAQRASALTRQVLAFSRQQVVEPKPLDLNAVVADIERMLSRLIGEDVALAFHPAQGLWLVLADRGQIEQALVNLAVNARDAMPQGGQLSIETANVELDDDFTRAHAGTRSGPYVRLRVTDTGVGMDADTRARIFEPFFTTKAKDKGTGLGLATVYGIVAQSAGHIWVESEPHRGTTFTIYLPRTDGHADTAAGRDVEVPRGSEAVLIVEDDDGVRHVAASALRALGYRVDVAASGEEGLTWLTSRTTPPDLVVTDVVLKGMSGVELAAQAHHVHPALRVLFMSGYADSALLRRGPIQGGAHFIQKPFTTAELGRKVRDALGGTTPT
jgi:signal transduction histidine kinase/CheY-like chemotaxis protein